MSDDPRENAGRPGGAQHAAGPAPAGKVDRVTGGAGRSGPAPPGGAGTVGRRPTAAIALGMVVVIATVAGCARAADDDDDLAADVRRAATSTPTTTEPATTTTTTTTTTEPTPTTTTAPTTTTTDPTTTTTEPATTTTDEPSEDTRGSQDVYAVGDTATSSDLDVTLLAVQDPYVSPNEFDTPQPGNRFVATEVELTNDTSEPIAWSSWSGAELTDDLNRPWTVALAGIDLPQLDGDVPAGGARRGWVVFEVPQDATGLQLRIKGSLTSTGSLFALS